MKINEFLLYVFPTPLLKKVFCFVYKYIIRFPIYLIGIIVLSFAEALKIDLKNKPKKYEQIVDFGCEVLAVLLMII